MLASNQDPTPEDDELLTKEQFKKGVPVSDPTLWRWEKKGILVPVRIGKSRFWRKSDQQRLVREGAPG